MRATVHKYNAHFLICNLLLYKSVIFFFHFINQIIDGYMSIIQLTAFLFIGWKHTTYEKKNNSDSTLIKQKAINSRL